ncbi:hypothetical protein K505DRAFT_388562 [Melanomma pulvis-pyrius CBS 109.77]|uniref:Uncharacterized protein n=1 Tax=Melanomma pulvis-pyrius CBS 109.77 TaxID=1314802 RepID=A0A6A6X7B0_9PLEO|nr:hypothetical protein K505DRAFT_388562 [Melanomma pulvis-pyrius CBS 109.77]
MPTLSPALLRQATQLCYHYEGEALTQCLLPFFGDPDSVRGIKEILFRSMAIHIAAIASYGHLLSLQHVTKWRSPYSYLSLFLFILFPELSAVQVLFRTLKVSFRAFRVRKVSIRYFLAACMGMHVADLGCTRPLDELLQEQVECQPRRHGLLWMGRLFLLLALLAQYLGTISLWLHSRFVYHDRENLGCSLTCRTPTL